MTGRKFSVHPIPYFFSLGINKIRNIIQFDFHFTIAKRKKIFAKFVSSIKNGHDEHGTSKSPR